MIANFYLAGNAMFIFTRCLSVTALFYLSLLLLSSCGGSDQATTIISDPGQSVQMSLGSDGELDFALGSLPPSTRIKVTQVPLPFLPAVLQAVGTAWKIEVAQQPKIPVKVKLRIPPGEDGMALSLIRVASNGGVTLLQTEMEDNQLVAYTPGFSTIVAARLQQALAGFRPSITGPDLLPTGVAGEYQEDGFKGIPGLQREWFQSPLVATDEVILSDIQFSTDIRGNSRARFKSEDALDFILRVEFREPSSGIKVQASKVVRVVEELTDTNLHVAIYGPAIVQKGEKFSVTGRVINTPNILVRSWSCRLGLEGRLSQSSCGECATDCSKIFIASGLKIDNVGKYQLTLKAEGEFVDDVGEQTLNIEVLGGTLDVRLGDGRVTSVYTDVITPQELWDPQSKPVITQDLVARVMTGIPGFTYEWEIQPLGKTIRDSNLDIDVFSAVLDQPGGYRVLLTVTDSAGHTFERIQPLFLASVNDAQLMQVSISGLPSQRVEIKQPVKLDFSVSGAELISWGQKFGYAYTIDWGDQASDSQASGVLDADKVQLGGQFSLIHHYQTVGDYTIRFAALPAYYLEAGEAGDVFAALERLGRFYSEGDDELNFIRSATTSASLQVDEPALNIDRFNRASCNFIAASTVSLPNDMYDAFNGAPFFDTQVYTGEISGSQAEINNSSASFEGHRFVFTHELLNITTSVRSHIQQTVSGALIDQGSDAIWFNTGQFSDVSCSRNSQTDLLDTNGNVILTSKSNLSFTISPAFDFHELPDQSADGYINNAAVCDVRTGITAFSYSGTNPDFAIGLDDLSCDVLAKISLRLFKN